jgi:hypothetical protein
VAWIVVWVKIGGKIFGAQRGAFIEATVADWTHFLNIFGLEWENGLGQNMKKE